MSTRDRVLDAALASFSTRGYEATSLDALAAGLGVRKQTILYYFASKEALLDAIGDARDRGVAILLVSDDFEDLRVCTRLLIMVRGVVAREFTEPPWERQRLISAVEGLVEQDG